MHSAANFKGLSHWKLPCYLAAMNELLNIAGPAGNLEARLGGPDVDVPARLAILCHPHPLYGGSMDDMVLGTVASALAAEGIASLRFNFRGVGASDGHHDGKGGEVGDLEAVLDWARTRYPDASLLLGGYSFGASTVCSLLEQKKHPTLERVILVAPPVGNLPAPEPDGSVRTDVFAGDADAFVDQSALAAWQHAEVHLLSGTDHFFAGRWQDLEAEVRAALGR